MLKSRLYLVMAILGIIALLAGACAKPSPSPVPAPAPTPTKTGTVEIRATDAPPTGVSSIMVTAGDIEVHKANTAEDKWITVVGEEKTFDLVAIQGAEIFLGKEEVQAGNYTQIRLEVTKVTVTLDDKEITAKLPSGKLKVVRPWEVKPGEVTVLTLDFDADKFVVITGKNRAQVKPVIKLDVSQGERPLKTLALERPKQVSVEVSCNDFYKQPAISKELKVAVGESFGVTLCSNPTTGFKWSETAQISDQNVLEQVDHKLVIPQSQPPPPPGTPGQEVWTFKTLKAGEATISMEYSQPWEGGEKATWTFILTVAAK